MTTYPEFVRRSVSFVLIALAVIAAVLLVTRIYPILILGLLSWIIAVGLSTPINYLRRKGLGRGVATLVTFALSLVALGLFIRLLLPALVVQVDDLISQLPSAGELAVESYDSLRTSSEALASLLPEFTVEDYRELLDTTIDRSSINFTAVAGSALPLIADVGGFLANILLNLFLIFFLTLYFTLDPLVYYRMIIAVIPAEREKRALEVLEQIRQTVVLWVGSMVLEVTITAVLVAFALGLILRVPNAIALGLLAGLGNIVPYVGYWAALIPIVIFAAAVGGPLTAILSFVFYFVIGIVEANIILPTNLGNSLKLPAALILLSQGIAATLLGFWGVLLAVPILAIISTLVRELIVFDALGKRGRVPHIRETPEGELLLEDVSNDSPDSISGQETPLTEDEDDLPRDDKDVTT